MWCPAWRVGFAHVVPQTRSSKPASNAMAMGGGWENRYKLGDPHCREENSVVPMETRQDSLDSPTLAIRLAWWARSYEEERGMDLVWMLVDGGCCAQMRPSQANLGRSIEGTWADISELSRPEPRSWECLSLCCGRDGISVSGYINLFSAGRLLPLRKQAKAFVAPFVWANWKLPLHEIYNSF